MRPVSRKDPAPSVLRYRLARLWLSHRFRALVRVGPIVILVIVLVLHTLTDRTVRAQLAFGWHAMRGVVANREEFRVGAIRIDGAGPAAFDAVSRLVAARLPASSLDLDLSAIRTQIEALPAIATAAVRIGAGGVLQVDVIERLPVMIWRHAGALSLLDADGTDLGTLPSRTQRPDLPLVLGSGAKDHVREAMLLLAVAEPIATRVRALQRVSDRRWNLLLDRDQVIYLPHAEPADALRRVMGLHAADKILSRDVTVVDMRDATRPTLRLGFVALNQLRGTPSDGDDQ